MLLMWFALQLDFEEQYIPLLDTVLFTLIILTRVLSASSASSKAAQTTEWGPIKPAIDVDLSLPEVSRLANRSSLPHGGRIVQLSHGLTHYILDGPTRAARTRSTELW